ncbi:NADP-dependent oxidoreductase [Streptomyces sp. NPDC057062]|uniref:NADP-dependent oxidoreductase n=1 Tax=Streptomyces sp. NPDC057062 TaxID=3346011 RepID=UPI003642E1C6
MRAVVFRTFGGPEVLEVTETPLPEPGAGQIRIKVAAAALNPADLSLRAGRFGSRGLGTDLERLGLGLDVAGVVDGLADGISGPEVGTAVIAMVAGVREFKAYAEYVVVDAAAVAVAPGSVDLVHAATLPVNALTADQALASVAAQPGDRILITGAAGGVGGYAVQLARHAGLHVVAHARPGDAALLRELGAREAVSDLDGLTFDAAFDAAGLGDAVFASVRDDGAYVTTRPDLLPDTQRGIRVSAVQAAPDGSRLAQLAALVDQGVLTPRVAKTYPLAEAATAHAHFAEGGVRGRLVLVP